MTTILRCHCERSEAISVWGASVPSVRFAPLKPLCSASTFCPTAGSHRRSCFARRGSKARPADHRPLRLNQRISTSKAWAAKPYRPAVGQEPKMAKFHHQGRRRRDALRKMIETDIFEENHRFSQKTKHPGSLSIVNAANLAAGRRTASSCGSRTDLGDL
jgi:hypothetical protein